MLKGLSDKQGKVGVSADRQDKVGESVDRQDKVGVSADRQDKVGESAYKDKEIRLEREERGLSQKGHLHLGGGSSCERARRIESR